MSWVSSFKHIYKKTKLFFFFTSLKGSCYWTSATSHSFQTANKVSTLCVYQVRLCSSLYSNYSTYAIWHLCSAGVDPPATCRTHPFQSSGDHPFHTKPRPLLTCVARLACTLIAIDFVDAPPVVTGFALTVIQVYLTVESCRLTHV